VCFGGGDLQGDQEIRRKKGEERIEQKTLFSPDLLISL